ncbi:MAG: hypothetical protein NT001_02200, partial [Candidatus Woesearchaeota archaeon]|nr:hypothetical protein [Candidatus Woesearchaeota archaeon]
SGNSSIKRCYGSSVSSKTVRTIRTEVYARLACHNLFFWIFGLLGQSQPHQKLFKYPLSELLTEVIIMDFYECVRKLFDAGKYRLVSEVEGTDGSRTLDYKLKNQPFRVVYHSEMIDGHKRETVYLAQHGVARGDEERMIRETCITLEDGSVVEGDQTSIATLIQLPRLPDPIRTAVKEAANRAVGQ